MCVLSYCTTGVELPNRCPPRCAAPSYVAQHHTCDGASQSSGGHGFIWRHCGEHGNVTATLFTSLLTSLSPALSLSHRLSLTSLFPSRFSSLRLSLHLSLSPFTSLSSPLASPLSLHSLFTSLSPPWCCCHCCPSQIFGTAADNDGLLAVGSHGQIDVSAPLPSNCS